MNGRGPKVDLPWWVVLRNQKDGDNDKDSVYSVNFFSWCSWDEDSVAVAMGDSIHI